MNLAEAGGSSVSAYVPQIILALPKSHLLNAGGGRKICAPVLVPGFPPSLFRLSSHPTSRNLKMNKKAGGYGVDESVPICPVSGM